MDRKEFDQICIEEGIKSAKFRDSMWQSAVDQGADFATIIPAQVIVAIHATNSACGGLPPEAQVEDAEE